MEVFEIERLFLLLSYFFLTIQGKEIGNPTPLRKVDRTFDRKIQQALSQVEGIGIEIEHDSSVNIHHRVDSIKSK